MAAHVNQLSLNEVVILCPFDQAFSLVSGAFMRVGSIRINDKSQQYMSGVIKYGLQSVKVRASLVERSEGKTNVVIQASSDDVWNAGARNATQRLVEAIRNHDNPGYAPDRLGMHPGALTGLVLAFIIILIIILVYATSLLS
jgi:hypothetical protein